MRFENIFKQWFIKINQLYYLLGAGAKSVIDRLHFFQFYQLITICFTFVEIKNFNQKVYTCTSWRSLIITTIIRVYKCRSRFVEYRSFIVWSEVSDVVKMKLSQQYTYIHDIDFYHMLQTFRQHITISAYCVDFTRTHLYFLSGGFLSVKRDLHGL